MVKTQKLYMPYATLVMEMKMKAIRQSGQHITVQSQTQE